MSEPTISIQLVTTAKYGSVLTDSNGRALYFFALDANGTSSCSGGCAAAWPVFYKQGPTLSAGLDSADFSSIVRADGALQTTYKGWPLYYYQLDAAGQINGDASDSTWFVAKPDYTVMFAKAQLRGLDSVQYNSQGQPGTGRTTYLTDAYGRTLYGFTRDKYLKNNYTAADFSNNARWPLYEMSTIKSIPSTLDKSLLATISVFTKTQLTFKGWPLYYFGADEQKRGNTKGVSVPTPGVWPIVNLQTTTAPQ